MTAIIYIRTLSVHDIHIIIGSPYRVAKHVVFPEIQYANVLYGSIQLQHYIGLICLRICAHLHNIMVPQYNGE